MVIRRRIQASNTKGPLSTVKLNDDQNIATVQYTEEEIGYQEKVCLLIYLFANHMNVCCSIKYCETI